MSVVSISAGLFCHGEEVAGGVAKGLGCRLVDDDGLVELAAVQGRLGAGVLQRVLSGKKSVFDHLHHEQEMAVSQFNLAVALLVAEGNLVLWGLGSHLIPSELPQVLRVCLIADTAYRIKVAAGDHGLSEKEARGRLLKSDQMVTRWADQLHGVDPWQAELYDLLLPMDKRGIQDAVELICRHGDSDIFAVTDKEATVAQDYVLAARVQLALAEKGHFIRAHAVDSKVTLEINKRVLRPGRLEAELQKLAGSMEGVAGVEVKPGPGAHKADIYRAHDFQAPAKILLVDDEQEFVETLSERLMLRDMNAAVVYDGRQALEVVAGEEPEVMVLDLMMPGIDGMEVLHTMKRDHPRVPVVVLTGHGTTHDREACLAAGAFAFLQKPVDIEELSEIMRRAHQQTVPPSVEK